MNQSSSVAIVILNWNGKHDTVRAISALPDLKQIIVVDNGSTDGSVPFIKEKFPSITLLETHENLGYAEGNNRGIAYALEKNFSFILILNNDTIPSSNLIETLLKEASQNREIGIFGAKPILEKEPTLLDHLGGVWNPKKGLFDLIGYRNPISFHYEGPLDYVCGCAMFVRSTVFQTIGLFNPNYFLFWEEADFCLRAKKHQIGIKICHEATLLHRVSGSFSGGKPHSLYFWWRGRIQWIFSSLSPKERWTLLLRVIIPEIFHLIKKRGLASLQVFLKKISGHPFTKKEQELNQYSAALKGCLHGFMKKRGTLSRFS